MAFNVYRQAQQPTVERNEPVDALRAWLHRAETVVKLMLKGKSQLLALDVV